MERGRRAIVADIGGQPALERRRVDPGKVRGLVDIAALGQDPQEFGFRREALGGHGLHLGSRTSRDRPRLRVLARAGFRIRRALSRALAERHGAGRHGDDARDRTDERHLAGRRRHRADRDGRRAGPRRQGPQQLPGAARAHRLPRLRGRREGAAARRDQGCRVRAPSRQTGRVGCPRRRPSSRRPMPRRSSASWRKTGCAASDDRRDRLPRPDRDPPAGPADLHPDRRRAGARDPARDPGGLGPAPGRYRGGRAGGAAGAGVPQGPGRGLGFRRSLRDPEHRRRRQRHADRLEGRRHRLRHGSRQRPDRRVDAGARRQEPRRRRPHRRPRPAGRAAPRLAADRTRSSSAGRRSRWTGTGSRTSWRASSPPRTAPRR